MKRSTQLVAEGPEVNNNGMTPDFSGKVIMMPGMREEYCRS